MVKATSDEDVATVVSEAPERTSAGVLRKAAWWALVAMVFFVPIVTGNIIFPGFKVSFTYDSIDLVKLFVLRVLVLFSLGAWTVDLLIRGGRIRHTPVSWLVVGFLAWVGVTTVTSIHPPTSLFGVFLRYEGLLTFLTYAVIYFLVLQFVDSMSRVRTLARSLFFSSLLVSGYAVLQSIGLDPIDWAGAEQFWGRRAFSTYGNPDMLGGFLAFTLPVALALALSEDDTRWRLCYWAGFALNLLGWVVAFTRGAWLGGIVGLVLVIVIAIRHRVRLPREDWVPAGVAGAVLALLGVQALMSDSSSIGDLVRFGSDRLLSADFVSSGARLEIWQAAFSAIKARPILGFGADTFRFVFPTYRSVAYVQGVGYNAIADNVHDYPLQLAVGVGIVGALLLYGVFTWTAIRSARTVFSRSGEQQGVLLGGFWAAAASYLVYLFFGLSVVGSSFLLWIAMAVVLAPDAGVFEIRPPRWGRPLAACVLVLAAAGIVVQTAAPLADHAYLVANEPLPSSQTIPAALRAVRFAPYTSTYRTQVGLVYTDELLTNIGLAQQAHEQGADSAPYLEAAKASFDNGVSALRDAMAFAPADFDNYVHLANLYNIGGQVFDASYYGEAIGTANNGIALSPNGPAVRLQLARALLATSRVDEAISELESALEMDPEYAEAALWLSDAYVSQGRVADALTVLRRIEVASPELPDIAEKIKSLEASGTSRP